jgi:DNA-binding CsgD family transcriptional regulator
LHTDLHRVRSDWFAAAGPLHDGVTPVVPKPRPPAPLGGRGPGAPPRDRVAPGLSARELEVLRQLADRRSTTQTAAALAVSPNTVRGHVRTLQSKLAAPDRDGVVVRARTLGLL